MHTPKSKYPCKIIETSRKTFLVRSPQKMDPDMSTTLMKSHIKSLEDEIEYWKCR